MYLLPVGGIERRSGDGTATSRGTVMSLGEDAAIDGLETKKRGWRTGYNG